MQHVANGNVHDPEEPEDETGCHQHQQLIGVRQDSIGTEEQVRAGGEQQQPADDQMCERNYPAQSCGGLLRSAQLLGAAQTTGSSPARIPMSPRTDPHIVGPAAGRAEGWNAWGSGACTIGSSA